VAERHGLPAVIKEGEALVKNKNSLLSAIDGEHKKANQYASEKNEMNSTKDQYHRTALDKLKSYLKGSSIAELKERAAATPHPEDDHLVDEIIRIDAQVKEIKREAKEVQQQQASIAGQLEGLGSISRRYASKDYESSRCYFDGNFDINTFLLGYIAGNYSASEVNHQIDTHQHFRPRETYSSYSSGSSSYGGGSSWSSGSDSSFGGGSFSSGGGFGGGGSFSSGSGF
ncbi:MAG: hypothetical protein AABY26_06115, partial [Nanoarchaeota archaeon]